MLGTSLAEFERRKHMNAKQFMAAVKKVCCSEDCELAYVFGDEE